MGLTFLNCKKSASGPLSRGDNTADFKHVGMQPSRREILTMLVIVGSNRSVHCLIMEDGNGSKTQDFESSVAACSLMSSSFISVKVENLVEDVVSTSTVTHSAESLKAFFLTRRSLRSVSILVVNKNRRKAIFKWAAKGLFFLKGGGGYTHSGYHKTLSATIACDRTSCETDPFERLS